MTGVGGGREYLRHDGGAREERQHPSASATLATAKNVDGEDAGQERGPVEAASEDRGRGAGVRWGGEGSGGSVVGQPGCALHHLGPGGGIRGEDAMVPGQMAPRGRDQRREATEEREGREHERRSTAPPGALQAVGDLAIGGQGKARKGERRSAGVAREPLEPEAVVGRDVSAGVGFNRILECKLQPPPNRSMFATWPSDSLSDDSEKEAIAHLDWGRIAPAYEARSGGENSRGPD